MLDEIDFDDLTIADDYRYMHDGRPVYGYRA